MKKRDDVDYLQHILGAILKIEEYCQGMDEHAFNKNTMAQDAVIRQFEIVGEATKNLTLTIKQKSAHVPWKAIAGTRDVLIHQYFGVDLGAVWQYAKTDLPALKEEVRRLIEKK